MIKSDIVKRQRLASDPHSGAWVSANAGSGKTKVLTDRYLRLLLSGVAAEKILCITFTKAAAAEMKQRIIAKLGSWVRSDDSELSESLQELTGMPASEELLAVARHLFIDLLDKPHGISISTVHSFCQSLLGRFPLESGVLPHFTLIDEVMALDLLDTATATSFDKGKATGVLHDSLQDILPYVSNTGSLRDILRKVANERQRLEAFWDCHSDYSAKLASFLGVDSGVSPQAYLEQKLPRAELGRLSDLVSLLGLHGHADLKKLAPNARVWLGLGSAARIERLGLIYNFFHTQQRKVRVRCMNKEGLQLYPHVADDFEFFADIIDSIYNYLCCWNLHRLNCSFLVLARDVIGNYEYIKRRLSCLDYDDLILKARDLLRSGGNDWVRYKLDGGIDHILVDEAQDTNPEQWDFIRALADDFFDNSGRVDVSPLPSLFVVGDEKQSIYRFQRADVKLFDLTRSEFTRRAEDAIMRWENIALQVSFRSSPVILDFVDEVFGGGVVNRGLGDDRVKHRAHYEDRVGYVEICSPFVKVKERKKDSIEDTIAGLLRVEGIDSDHNVRLADAVANKVSVLADRGVNAGDIMILMRKRGTLMNKIIMALKRRGIAVAGVDRLRLTEHSAVQDLLALADFCLLKDDLTLAGLLKSPFIAFDEERIYDLCRGRLADGRSLWSYLCLRSESDSDLSALVSWFRRRFYLSGRASRYEFFATALSDTLPLVDGDGYGAFSGRLGAHVQEILEEFLDAAYDFENDTNYSGSLQEFLFSLRGGEGEVVRDMSVGLPLEVRIMTVHAAKGLESPIVILPDTVSRRNRQSSDDDFDFWTDNSGSDGVFLPDIPLWFPKFACDFTQKCKAGRQALADEEYHRLLYVAMTRAAHELYVFGACGYSKLDSGCWYSLILDSLGLDEEVVKSCQEGEGEVVYCNGEQSYESGESAVPSLVDELPAWLCELPADEVSPPRPMVASRPLYEEPAERSPLLSAGDDDSGEGALRYGVLIHSLLEILPTLAPDEREKAGQKYLSYAAGDWRAEERTLCLSQALQVINNPDFAEIFSDKGRAEVGISGTIAYGDSDELRLVSARLDRLLVDDNRVLVIDYKSSTKVPKQAADIAEVYKQQMQIYKSLLASIYPNRPIRTAILWTHTATLMEL